jgi:NADH-quinone oxidoreductase subunit E
MLTEEERGEIEAEIPRYGRKAAVCIDAMKIVQRHRGWVSEEAIQDIAAFLEMASDELDSVATFYNLIFRKPVGRHVIMLCNSVSCWIMGYERVQERLQDRLGVEMGATTTDGRFTLLPIVCLGACDHAPAMVIDNDLIGDVDGDRLDEALLRYP